MSERTNASFMTTHWTELAALDDGDVANRDRVLAALAERYWPPVYAYLRHRGLAKEAASELAQAFFTEVVLGRDLFGRATRSRGRLRSLLLVALRNFCITEHRRDVARPIDHRRLDLEESRLASCGDVDAHASFERRWALAIFDETLQRCRRHFVDGGRAAHWELFEARVLTPASSGNVPPAMPMIPATASFADCAAASAALQVVKRRFEFLFREVVAETIGPDDELDAEVERVKSWFAGR